MARFQITDPQTGKTVTIEGDNAPTQQDAEQIFQQAGLRSNQSASQPQKQSALQGISHFLGNIGLGFIPQIGEAINQTANLALNKDYRDPSQIYQDPGQIKTGQSPEYYKNLQQGFQNQSQRGSVAATTGMFLDQNQLDRASNLKTAAIDVAKNTAGLASWAVPGKILSGAPVLGQVLSKAPGVVGAGVDMAAQGGLQSALQAISQQGATPQSVLGQATTGAIASPVMGAVGNAVTNIIPKYLGIRAYGPAGAKLPEVLNAQKEAGNETLKQTRDAIINNSKNSVNKSEIFQMIDDKAKQPEWIGSPGVQDVVRRGGATRSGLIQESGATADIKKAFNNSSNLFDFYNSVKNMAYPKGNTQADTRVANFMRSMAHDIREKLITSTENPDVTRKAMDIYAAQTAINAAKSPVAKNQLLSIFNKYLPGGELGAAGAAALVPGLHSLTIPMAIDAALTNRVVGPKIAGGLVGAGRLGNQQVLNTPVSDLLRRFGVGAIGAGGPQ